MDGRAIAGAALVAMLTVVLFGTIVADLVTESPEEIERRETLARGQKIATDFSSLLIGRARDRGRLASERSLRKASGRKPVKTYAKQLAERANWPEVGCRSTEMSTFDGITFDGMQDVISFTSARLADGTARIRYAIDVAPRLRGETMQDIWLDRGIDCNPNRAARITIHAVTSEMSYRRTLCAPTPGTYDHSARTWRFDTAWEEFEFTWDGHADATRKDGEWFDRKVLFPPGDARLTFELQGKTGGEPFKVLGEIPIVIGPFEKRPEEVECRLVPGISEPAPWTGEDPPPRALYPWPGERP